MTDKPQASNHKIIFESLRQLAYSLQRTGNTRCEAEAMEIHKKLDGCPLCKDGRLPDGTICECVMKSFEEDVD